MRPRAFPTRSRTSSTRSRTFSIPSSKASVRSLSLAIEPPILFFIFYLELPPLLQGNRRHFNGFFHRSGGRQNAFGGHLGGDHGVEGSFRHGGRRVDPHIAFRITAAARFLQYPHALMQKPL